MVDTQHIIKELKRNQRIIKKQIEQFKNSAPRITTPKESELRKIESWIQSRINDPNNITCLTLTVLKSKLNKLDLYDQLPGTDKPLGD